MSNIWFFQVLKCENLLVLHYSNIEQCRQWVRPNKTLEEGHLGLVEIKKIIKKIRKRLYNENNNLLQPLSAPIFPVCIRFLNVCLFPPSSLSSPSYLLIFFLHSISLLFPRSSGVWVLPLCCPVYLTLCPVRSEETKQGCLPLTKPSALVCFLLWVCGILLLESQINMFLTAVRKPRGHIPTRSKRLSRHVFYCFY